MTTEQPLPMSPKAALHDVKYFVENPPSSESADAELLEAAHVLALVIDRVYEMTASRIGADEFLASFDGGDFDNYSFYRGVQFALHEVFAVLNGQGRNR